MRLIRSTLFAVLLVAPLAACMPAAPPGMPPPIDAAADFDAVERSVGLAGAAIDTAEAIGVLDPDRAATARFLVDAAGVLVGRAAEARRAGDVAGAAAAAALALGHLANARNLLAADPDPHDGARTAPH
ncbi:MAG: hypothetical protein ACK4K7_06660 [Allosphingosinicella sp.]|uniref:hypothetical protein n=1 Tax=Allosphingosinicella sp. TaxID=2823234 RepID=UPI00392529B8